MCTKPRKFLSIGCIDTLNVSTFVPFYKQFIENHPEICLSVHTYHSSEIYSRLENHLLDLGYVIQSKERNDIKVTPLYQEPMVIVAHEENNYYDGMTLSELPPEKEIYLRWNEEYERMHDRLFPGKRYKLRVSTETMLYNFMDESGSWTVVPQSTGKNMEKILPVKSYMPADHLSTRRCYELEHKYSRTSRLETIELFKKEFHA